MTEKPVGWSSGDKTMEVLQEQWQTIALKIGKFKKK